MSDQDQRGLVAVSEIGRAVVLLLAMVAACAASEQTAEHRTHGPCESTSFEVAPGIVVVGDLEAVYLMVPEGGIEAVDVRSGELMWRREEAGRPLLVVGGRLMAQDEESSSPGVLALVFFDARKGGKCTVRAELPLPPEVRPLIGQRLGQSFSVRASVQGGAVVVTWHYLETDVTGVAPAHGAPPFRHNVSGASRIDIETGQITPVAGGVEATVQPIPAAVQQLLDAGEVRLPPWRVGDILAVVADRSIDGGRRTVVLQRWRADSGAPLPEVVLLDGPAVARVPSADRQHLMICSMPPVLGAGGERYLWSLFSLVTGEKQGEVHRHFFRSPVLHARRSAALPVAVTSAAESKASGWSSRSRCVPSTRKPASRAGAARCAIRRFAALGPLAGDPARVDTLVLRHYVLR